MDIKETTDLLATILDSKCASEKFMKGCIAPETRLYDDAYAKRILSARQYAKFKAWLLLYQNSQPPKPTYVRGDRDCADYFMKSMRHLKHEEFRLLCLDAKHKVISEHTVGKGSATGSVVHAREVFRQAILDSAVAIIVAHNHPSGDPAPSKEDANVTKHLREAGEILLIPLLDHIIIGNGKYFSYSSHNWANERG